MPATGEKLFPASFPSSDTMWCPSKIDLRTISVPIVLLGASHLLRQPIFIAYPLHSFIFGILIPDLNKYFITSRRKWAFEISHLLFLFYVYKQNHSTFNQFSLKHLYPSFHGNHYCTSFLCICHIQGDSEVFQDSGRSHLLSHMWKAPRRPGP